MESLLGNSVNSISGSCVSESSVTSIESSSVTSSRVIAVIASHFAAAEPLLDIAQQSDCTAIWCRQPGDLAVRGVDTVWWDDSFAGPTDTSGWLARLQLMGTKATQHTWITNRMHWLQIDQAKQAGVGLVLSKPYPVNLLLNSIGLSPASSACDQAASRAA